MKLKMKNSISLNLKCEKFHLRKVLEFFLLRLISFELIFR